MKRCREIDKGNRIRTLKGQEGFQTKSLVVLTVLKAEHRCCEHEQHSISLTFLKLRGELPAFTGGIRAQVRMQPMIS
ncbi:hypothetical protein RJ639_029324 [Escallonia herrerae]|uniref:Uncharacterized protein n=1 Tax=Escallonia herrerae TaxID=1293975 RepID=A0AA88X4H6_9ASTE|nr:hypothetical protein RJ639_029324 [Escallonia herrerae]